MKVAQGLAAAVMCLLLFICLAVLGIGLLINTTVLNPDFIVKHVDAMDIEQAAREIIENEDLIELPAEIEFATPYVYDVIGDYEPWLKTQAETIIRSSYAYLLGEREDFSISIPLTQVKNTLKPKLWEIVQENLAEVIPLILQSNLAPVVEQYVEQYVRLVPSSLLPPGTLDLTSEQIISVLRGYLNKTNLTLMMMAVPQLRGLLEQAVQPYFDEYIDEFINDIPDIYVLDEAEIGTEAMQQLQNARTYIGYFRAGFYALIGVAIVVVIGIILIYRRILETGLSLGITFTLFGAVTLAGTLFGRSVAYAEYLPSEIPDSVRASLNGVFSEALMPLLWFGAGMLVIGVVLILLAILTGQRTADD